GEQLKVTPQIIRFFGELPSTVLFNQYGPTEAHVVSSLKLDGPASLWPELPTIGTPIDNVDLLILNEDRQPVENGEIGELCVAGVCLAEGYFNDPALTSERFIEWTHPTAGIKRIYRTGELARRLEAGEFEFLGRIDPQLSISGHRAEL